MKLEQPISTRSIPERQPFPGRKDHITTVDFLANALKKIKEEMKQIKEMKREITCICTIWCLMEQSDPQRRKEEQYWHL